MNRLRRLYSARLEWVPGAYRPRPLRAGAIALLALGVLLVVAFTGSIPFVGGGGRLVRAEFRTADQLVAGRTPVRVGGVDVGEVDHVEPGPRGRTSVVVMRITDADLALARDASAQIRFRTVLGGTRYVDLDPGSPSAPPLGDALIPGSRTSSQVDWDQFNQPFERGTRVAQRRALRGLRKAFAAPEAIGSTIETLGPSLSVIGRGAGALRGRESGELRRLVAATADTFDALSRERAALEGLVDGAERTLAVTAARRRELGQVVALSPRALASTTRTMRRLEPMLDRLDPLVAELRPGARRLAPATRALGPGLDEAQKLLRRAAPLLRSARPTLGKLASTGREGVPLMGGLSPVLRRAEDELLPFLRRRDTESGLRNYEALGPTFAAVDGWAGGFDAAGHFVNFTGDVAADSVIVPCGPDLTPPERKRCDLLDRALRELLGGSRR